MTDIVDAGMSDNSQLSNIDLRTRIAAVIDREVDGFWEPLDVADAVIRELQLTVLGDGIVVGVIHE